jgi:putative peptide zinc metalloprotease protein
MDKVNEIDKIWNNNTFIVLIVLFISSIYHELGHATAACYYNCKVGDIGVGLYLFKPVLYTDLSSTWKLSRKRRVIIDMGGIYFQLVMVNAISLLLLFLNSSELKVAVLSIIVLAILNLNPFLRLDGYWILTDWLGIVNVNNRVFSLIKNKFSKYILKRDYDEDNLELKPVTRAILYGYMFIYLLFTVVALVFGMYMIVQLVTGEVNLYTIFLDLVRTLKEGSFNTFFPAFNKLIVQLLPYVYIAIMIISLVRNIYKRKKTNTKRR